MAKTVDEVVRPRTPPAAAACFRRPHIARRPTSPAVGRRSSSLVERSLDSPPTSCAGAARRHLTPAASFVLGRRGVTSVSANASRGKACSRTGSREVNGRRMIVKMLANRPAAGISTCTAIASAPVQRSPIGERAVTPCPAAKQGIADPRGEVVFQFGQVCGRPPTAALAGARRQTPRPNRRRGWERGGIIMPMRWTHAH